MSEGRLIEILQKEYEKDFNYIKTIMPNKFPQTYLPTVLEAMKQAVNEAIQECADKAMVTDNGEDFADCIGIENEYGNFSVCVCKQSILKLKVK